MPADGGAGMKAKMSLTRTMLRSILLAILSCQLLGHAQSGPLPPCGQEPIPLYSPLDSPPAVTFWSESAFGRGWRPPACTGWTAAGYSTLISMAGRFRYGAGSDSLLRHIGAVSELAGMRYWSTTHQHWQTLIVSAHALTDPPLGRQRPDFMPAELEAGKIQYLEQNDNLAGPAIYRLHVSAASADRVVFDVENVGAIRYLFVTLFHPGEMQSIYFLDRESDSVWRYYSLTRIGRNASRLATGPGHASSSINRAVAFYRALAGIPTDQEPPAAR